ncbi:separase [Iris pallida]|uniref:Separase n=1 Tax=Iris pallida TaxID=29817 RepID=A0AAX6HEP2_IRIPA|nr:separase [Iris pallida]
MQVSQLLALMLISKQRSFPHPLFSGSSLSIDHWVAYFHQASIVTYIPAQYLAWKGPTINSKNTEALSHARMALQLRASIVASNFIEQESADSCLQAIGSIITEFWPDHTKCSQLKIPLSTPWSVLRCHLESLLQVGIINESIGNGTEAESSFKRGKVLSVWGGFPIFHIVFTTFLGQVYRKQQLYHLAEKSSKMPERSLRKISLLFLVRSVCCPLMLQLACSLETYTDIGLKTAKFSQLKLNINQVC